MKRRLSRPTSALFGQADVSPDAVDHAIDDLVTGKASAVLRTNHPIVQQVRRTTDINLVQIARRSRYLLITVEQHGDRGPAWHYREITPRDCVFSCPGQLPPSIEEALNGELLETLVMPAVAMREVRIDHVGDTGDGWLSVQVTPTWIEF